MITSNTQTLPPLPLVDGALLVDNSGWLENIQACGRKTEYSQLWRKILAGEKPALNFGSVIHLGLEYRHVVYGNQPVDDFYYEEVSVLFEKFFEEHPCPEGDFRTLNHAMNVMRKYNERYTIEDFNLLKYDAPIPCPYCKGEKVEPYCIWCRGSGTRSVMVEVPFILHLYDHENYPGTLDTGSIPVYYIGKIDFPIDHHGIFVFDHKTAGTLGQQFWDKMKMSAQQKGYCWSFEQITKRKVKGYYVNAIRTKEPPNYVINHELYKAKKQSPEQWWMESFQREYNLLKDNELEEWKDNTIALFEEFFWHYHRGYFPMRTTWCNQFGRCPYFDVCSLESGDRMAFLNSGAFTDNNWSPLSK